MQPPFSGAGRGSFLESAAEGIGEFFLDILIAIGCALGAGPAAAAPIIDELRQDSYELHPTAILSPAELAEAVLKSATDDAGARAEARKSGVDEGHFNVLLEMTGNPPGAETLLAMLRRGLIDEPTFELGLRQGYTRNDWVRTIAELRMNTLPLGEAIAGVVQNHLDRATALDRAAKVGVYEGDFDLMVANAGNPPGPMELLNLWVRGYIDEPTVDQGLRESRLKDKWIDPLKKLAVRKIPLRTITMLLNNGAINDDQARQHLRELGYSDADAGALIAGHKAPKAAPHHELGAAQVRDLYQQHLVSRDAAVFDLVRAGYTQDDANAVLDLADRMSGHQLQTQGIGAIRSAYLARRIAREVASGDLDRMFVPAGQRDALLTLWDIEQRANVKQLTPAQIVAAGKKGLLTEQEVVARLVGEGYTEDDAILLAMLGGAIALPAQ